MDLQVYSKQCCMCDKGTSGHLRKIYRAEDFNHFPSGEIHDLIEDVAGFELRIPIDMAGKLKICVSCKNTMHKFVTFRNHIKYSVLSLNSSFNGDPDYAPLDTTAMTNTRTKDWDEIQPLDSDSNDGVASEHPVPVDETQNQKFEYRSSYCDHTTPYHSYPTNETEETSQSTDQSYNVDKPLDELAEDAGKVSLKHIRDIARSRKECVSVDEKRKVKDALCEPRLTQAQLAEVILECPGLLNAVKCNIVSSIHSMCDKLVSSKFTPGPSVLKNEKNKSSLDSDLISKAILEFQKCMPLPFEIFSALVAPMHVHKPNTHLILGVIYGIAMFNRNPLMNAILHVNTAACMKYHRGSELLSYFNKIGITVSEKSANSLRLDFDPRDFIPFYQRNDVSRKLLAAEEDSSTVKKRKMSIHWPQTFEDDEEDSSLIEIESSEGEWLSDEEDTVDTPD